MPNSCPLQYDIDDLSDVNLSDVGIVPIADGDVLVDSEFSRLAIRALGDDILETRDGLLDWLEAMVTAKDRFEEHKARTKGADRVFGRPLREQLLAWLRQGDSIVDWPKHADMSWDDTLRLLTNGTRSKVWAWDEKRWIEVEGAILDLTKRTAWTVMNAARVSESQAESLCNWYFGIERRGERSKKRQRGTR